jgi:carbamoyltransferase
MVDGEIVFASSQERYDLRKHSRAFPADAVNTALRFAGLSIDGVDEIAFANDPAYHVRRFYLEPALSDDRRLGFMRQDLKRVELALNMEAVVREATGFRGRIGFYRHHLCHLAGAYFPSGFNDALLMSLDGMGEIETGMFAIGRNGKIEPVHTQTLYPNSLGLIYSAITYYLGWQHHCDEGIIMGLASYGDPHATVPGRALSYYEVFSEIIRQRGDFDYEVSQDWIAFHLVRDTWVSGLFYETFGPRRLAGEAVTDHHRNIAAALQLRLETVVLRILEKLESVHGYRKLCISGGVGLNCSMNGKIAESGIFDEIFVQPASGDDGSTFGVCYLAAQRAGHGIAPRVRESAYLGQSFSDEVIERAVRAAGLPFLRPANLFEETAQLLNSGNIVAWFQGRSEFGPRALGSRSILARPFPAEMKDHINRRVKFREDFRPFAPAVLEEYAQDFFHLGQRSPHMLIAAKVREEIASRIPAVVHVDGTCRVQTVSKQSNGRFHGLLEAFHRCSGLPVLLNTSFNVKGQPMVNDPEQALRCFQSTDIDYLVIGDFIVGKQDSGAKAST